MPDDDDLVTLQTYWNREQAQLACTTLCAASIDASLMEEYSAALVPNHTGGVRLQVRRSELELARAVLETPDPAPLPDEPFFEEEPPVHPLPTCPRCGSEELYPAVNGRTVLARGIVIMTLGFAGLAALPENGMFLAVIAGGLAYMLFEVFLGRTRCRACDA